MSKAMESFKRQLEDFSKYLTVYRGLAVITVDGYHKLMIMVLRTLKTTTPTHKELQDFMAEFLRKGYSYSHIVNTSLAMERYMEFIDNPFKLGRPKKPKRIIRDTLSEAEVASMIRATRNVRDKAILTILAYSGIRSKELCALRVNDINLGNNSIRILLGKGQKDRVCNIAPQCVQVLIEYVQAFPRPGEAYLFTTMDRGKKYNGNALRKTLKKIAKQAGIKRRVWPYQLRHSLATNLMKRGANILTVKEQLGHAFIDTTMVYVHSMTERSKAEYGFFAPAYM